MALNQCGYYQHSSNFKYELTTCPREIYEWCKYHMKSYGKYNNIFIIHCQKQNKIVNFLSTIMFCHKIRPK